MEIKHCPFCKKEITSGTVKCPNCAMTLIEKLSYREPLRDNGHAKTNQATNRQSNPHKSSEILAFLKQLKIRANNYFAVNKKEKYKILGVIIATILFIYGVYPRHENNTIPDVPSIQPNLIPIQQLDTISLPQTVQQKMQIVSLGDGTILSRKLGYFAGYGELNISNGTSKDAIAKLISTTIDKSVLTVYIKANSSYTMTGISDGNYKLVFSLGHGWDEISKQFVSSKSYEVFDDPFYFTTRVYEEGDYERTNYTTFKVTLNPVLYGDAKTSSVNPDEFNSY